MTSDTRIRLGNAEIILHADGTFTAVLPRVGKLWLRLTPVREVIVEHRGHLERRYYEETPPSIKPIIEYAVYLTVRYGKRVELSIVRHKNREYLRFKREDGIPIYVDTETRDTYVPKRYAKSDIVPMALSFFWYSCGYRQRYRRIKRGERT